MNLFHVTAALVHPGIGFIVCQRSLCCFSRLCFHFTGSNFCRDSIVIIMDKLRETVDRLESLTDRADWPYPDYGTILFSVK